jgi:hypothetical protein
MPKEKNMEKWEIITPDLTGEYIRSEYRREIIETGGTRDPRDEVIEHLMTDARHNFSEQEANAFYDEALEARKEYLAKLNEEVMAEIDVMDS